MTGVHFAQLGLAGVALGVIGWRVRVLFYLAPLPERPFRRLLVSAIGRGERERASRMAERLRPAWIGEVAITLLSAEREGEEPLAALGPAELEVAYEAERGLLGLRIFASLASALGLLGALLELVWLLRGQRGLEGLVLGLPERLAFERAMLSMLIGVATTVVCLYARSLLRRRAARLLGDVRSLASALLAALGVKMPGEMPFEG